MNLFFKRIFGGFQSTNKFEAIEKQLIADYHRYKKVESSDELKEYRRLFELVKSADFKQKKKILQNRKYKDTQESRDMHAFHRYHSNSKIKLYYHTLKSRALPISWLLKTAMNIFCSATKERLKKRQN